MLAYAHLYGTMRLVLLYPWHSGMGEKGRLSRKWKIAGTDHLLDIVTIDVGRPEQVVKTFGELLPKA